MIYPCQNLEGSFEHPNSLLLPLAQPHIPEKANALGRVCILNFLAPLAWREQARKAKNKMRRRAHEVFPLTLPSSQATRHVNLLLNVAVH